MPRRPDFVIDSTFDLFVDLGANDEQCDFPVVYASGANGVAGGSPEELAEDLAPLFEAIVREASCPGPCFVGVSASDDKLIHGMRSAAVAIIAGMERVACMLHCLARGLHVGVRRGDARGRSASAPSVGCAFISSAVQHVCNMS